MYENVKDTYFDPNTACTIVIPGEAHHVGEVCVMYVHDLISNCEEKLSFMLIALLGRV